MDRTNQPHQLEAAIRLNELEIEALSVLQAGGSFHYAPVSGGLILLQKDGNKAARHDLQTFLSLRKQGLIDMSDSMRQGHHIFHGQVDTYRVTDTGKEFVLENRETPETSKSVAGQILETREVVRNNFPHYPSEESGI